MEGRIGLIKQLIKQLVAYVPSVAANSSSPEFTGIEASRRTRLAGYGCCGYGSVEVLF